MGTKTFNKLSIKLILAISLMLIVTLAVHTYVTVANLQDYLTQERYQSAFNISDLIKKSTRYSMLLNRREDVHQIINTIATEHGVRAIRIYNKAGVIIYSSDSSEIQKKVNLTAEACIACHTRSIPLKSLTSEDRVRIFKSTNKLRALGLINPIKNEEDCSSSACHAHPPDIEILGVLDVILSLETFDKIMAENTSSTITNAMLITLMISAFAGFFITILVNKPLKKISKGIEEVGKGNLSYKIKINSKDELGQVAARFNDMALKLDAAYREIKDWSETLNQKVKEKTEELKNIYSQVIQIEKLASLGKLSATVAHELNNPLEGILTYCKLISKKLKENQQDGEHSKLIEYLDLIAGESSRCGKIVKDLLLFSHRGDDQISRTSIVDIVDKSVALIKHHLEMNHITLEKDFSIPDLYIVCNPQKVQQAIMSLLINSIEAMPHGGKIVIRTDKEDETHISIRVIDQGCGISPKDLPHIFEPFYSTKEASKGTGLGLSVVYGIVKQHKGEVFVENTSENGTTIKIILTTDLNNN